MIRKLLLPIPDMNPSQFYLRLAWIGVQLILVYYLAGKNDPFFYQGF